MEKIQDNQGKEDPDNISSTIDLLVFYVENIRFAVPAILLDHVVRMVRLTPVPDAPRGVGGVINYHGDIIPVFSLRDFFSLPAKDISPSDFLLLIKGQKNLAIIAEKISGVYAPPHDVQKPDTIYPGISGISGLYRCDDGLMVLTSPEELFSLSDEEQITHIVQSLAPL